jgi:hypothetical protein
MKVEMDQLGGGPFLIPEIFTRVLSKTHFYADIMLAETFQNIDMHREEYTI